MEDLPRVTEGVAASVQGEILAADGEGYFSDLMERLEERNPHLAVVLSGFALQHENQAAVAAAGLLVYRLLESQAEADRMGQEFA